MLKGRKAKTNFNYTKKQLIKMLQNEEENYAHDSDWDNWGLYDLKEIDLKEILDITK